jgi:hypothetical protein
VPKHVGVLIIVMNCILLSAVVCGHIDWKVNKLNFSHKPVKDCQEEQRLRVSEDRALTKVFGPNGGGAWRKLHAEELHDWYC